MILIFASTAKKFHSATEEMCVINFNLPISQHWKDVNAVVSVLYVTFQDSGRPEIPKQYFSFADVSDTVYYCQYTVLNMAGLIFVAFC